jgi:SM-20-related protein
MEDKYEELIVSYLDEKVGQANNFINEELAASLKKDLLFLYQEEKLKEAGIGNNAKLVRNKDIRTDMIYWLDRNQGNPVANAFFNEIDKFVKYMNQTCYSGITGYEFHYAFYEEGSFYKKHLDQFRDNNNRAFSMIIYLNENWQQGHGGELCVYLEEGKKLIAPTYATSVFFKSSELEHEVLLSNKVRLSVTGWFKVG